MRSSCRYFLVMVGALSLAACSDESNTSDPVGADTVVSTPTTAADILDTIHAPATGDFVGALVDITNDTCERVSEGWHVTGEATNPTAAAVDYRVYISLINGATTTRALVETEILSVAPGAVGAFDTVIAMPEDNLRCVLRVERRAPGT